MANPPCGPHIVGLVERLAALRTADGPIDLAMTTNGATLGLLARQLRAAGLARINISLDSLDPAKFAAMTRRDELHRVLDGITAAKEAGFDPVKLNTVVQRGVNDDELVELATFGRRARRRGAVHRVHAARRIGRLERRLGRRPGRDRRAHPRRVPVGAGAGRVARPRPTGGATSTGRGPSA